MAKDNSKTRLPQESDRQDTKPEYPNLWAVNFPNWRLEIDSTKDYQRFLEVFPGGSYTKVNKDGHITHMGVGDVHQYTKGSHTVTIDGFHDVLQKGSRLVVKGGQLLEFGGDLDFHSLGGVHFTAAKDFKVTGKNVLVAGDNAMSLAAAKGNFKMTSGRDFETHVGMNKKTFVQLTAQTTILAGEMRTVTGAGQLFNISGGVISKITGDFTKNVTGAVTRNITGAYNNSIKGIVNNNFGGLFNENITGAISRITQATIMQKGTSQNIIGSAINFING